MLLIRINSRLDSNIRFSREIIWRSFVAACILLAFGSAPIDAMARMPMTFVVATHGNDANPGTLKLPLKTIQRGLNLATTPGDRVLVRGGKYNEKIRFRASGNANGGYISLMPYRGEKVVLDGTGIAGQNMVLIDNQSYIRFSGFEIVNNKNVTDGSGIRVVGSGKAIQLTDHQIHEMRGRNAMGITVYATEVQPISQLLIKGNHIFDCDPAPSEALVLNGNVSKFRIEANVVENVNNIGIDAIGGETDIHPDPSSVARNGRIIYNTVRNCNSNYGGGYAAGIYVDGGRNILIEGNEVSGSDLGIEIGAENAGIVTEGIRVQNNLIHNNQKAGLVFGGYDMRVGRVKYCRFLNNTLYSNDLLDVGYGQIWVSYASSNRIANNIVVAGPNNVLMYTETGNVSNRFDYNLYFSSGGENGSFFTWRDVELASFADYQSRSKQDSHSLFGDPRLQNPSLGRFWLRSNSPAIDAGFNLPGWYPPLDFESLPRPFGAAPDIGAYEFAE